MRHGRGARIARWIGFTLSMMLAVSAGGADRSAGAPGVSPKVRLALLWWPADAASPLMEYGVRIDKCLTEALVERNPGVEIVPQRSVRDGLFPLMEPSTQPGTEEALAALLERSDVHARLTSMGIRFLAVYSGRLEHGPTRGFVECTGYGCLGLAWQGETSTIDVAVWELEGKAQRGSRQSARATGTNVTPAWFIPVPIAANTEAKACADIGSRIGDFIRSRASELPPEH